MPSYKTKIVCTIGPASRDKDVLKQLIGSGMNVARLNFSHGDPEDHRKDILAIREISKELKKNVAVLADLPGPKIRIGNLKGGSCSLRKGDRVVLTIREVEGTSSFIPVQFEEFPECVNIGDRVFLNDGFIELKAIQKTGKDVICDVIIGGTLLSKKGMNLPDSHVTAVAVTERDLELLAFGMEQGVDMFGLSFVGSRDDVEKVRAFAKKKGGEIFIVSKIERSDALENIDGIIEASDGIMVARGDLGVEIAIEEVPIVQKQLILKANMASKPVITATQMLESMTANTRPTRAEVTDAANAIFDGTDAVMLSEETAIGIYPLEAFAMLAKIAMTAEARRSTVVSGTVVPDTILRTIELSGCSVEDTLSLNVIRSAVSLGIRSVVVPTRSGLTARRISRLKGDAWVLALCRDSGALRSLCLSYGVHPIPRGDLSSDEDIIIHLRALGLIGSQEAVILVRSDPCMNLGTANTMRIITPGP